MKNKLNFKRFLAFSVIELVITLIAVSCLMAGFAPAIQKKLKQNAFKIHNREVLTGNNCPDGCAVCYTDKCLLCVKICPGGQELDSESCTCVSCAEHCDQCSSSVCTNCDTGYRLTNGQCNMCDATYSWNSSNRTCTKCQGSSFCPGFNFTSQSCPSNASCSNGEYLRCNSGYYRNITDNNFYCSASGRYENYNSYSCSSCRSGYYCPDGIYEYSCPSNAVCSSNEIVGCNSAYSWNNSNQTCSACTGSQYCPGGKEGTRNCPDHASCSNGNFMGCNEGYHVIITSNSTISSDGKVTLSIWDESCAQCASDNYCAGGYESEEDCPTNYVCSGGTKAGCEPGYGWDSYFKTCSRCGSHTYSTGGVGAKCNECAPDENSNADNTGCYTVCPYYANCPSNASCSCNDFTCNAGYYKNGNVCSVCPTGTVCNNGVQTGGQKGYADTYGMGGGIYNCKKCTGLTYSDGGTQFGCEYCPSPGYECIDGIKYNCEFPIVCSNGRKTGCYSDWIWDPNEERCIWWESYNNGD